VSNSDLFSFVFYCPQHYQAFWFGLLLLYSLSLKKLGAMGILEHIMAHVNKHAWSKIKAVIVKINK